MAHWIKGPPREIYLVQAPDEVAQTPDLAFPGKTDPISGKSCLKVATASYRIPPGLEPDGPDAPGT
jgi:hypothetical protein